MPQQVDKGGIFSLLDPSLETGGHPGPFTFLFLPPTWGDGPVWVDWRRRIRGDWARLLVAFISLYEVSLAECEILRK
jgi:hypothetical protein